MDLYTKHNDSLSILCRLCRGKIVPKVGYKNPKQATEFKNQIEMLFNYNLSNDQPSVDPPKLCGSCARQIRSVENHCIPQPIAKFPEHSDSVSCDVCRKKIEHS
uniref:ZAD domain-containing protein n=1 Tax=Clytia hemisphaerica TaxID=252671 RepID=A0A7M5UGP1_9CNID|eukprot:TCONS_00057152-protein